MIYEDNVFYEETLHDNSSAIMKLLNIKMLLNIFLQSRKIQPAKQKSCIKFVNTPK